MKFMRRSWLILTLVAWTLTSAGSIGRADERPTGILIKFFACPHGMSKESWEPSDCSLVSDGFDISLRTEDGDIGPLTIADASFDGTNFVWDVDLSVARIWLLKFTVFPPGYSESTKPLEGSVFDPETGEWRFLTTPNPRIYMVTHIFSPGEPTSVTVNAKRCPANVTDFAGTCQNRRIVDEDYRIGGFPVTTGSDGTASHAVMPGVVIVGDEEFDQRYVDSYVTCVDEPSGTVLYDGWATYNAIYVNVPEGADTVCDWYNLTAPTQRLVVNAIICETDPGATEFGPLDDLPENCSLAAGVYFLVSTADVELFDDCTTDATGRCRVDPPMGEVVDVFENETGLPSGYVPKTNPITLLVDVGVTDIIFINLPDVGVTPTATFEPSAEPTEPELDPTATVAPDGTVLPSPVAGRPVHVHVGTCSELQQEPIDRLADVASPVGTPEGATEATIAETSFTVIAISLDELLASPYAIHVHLGRGAEGGFLACGDIGGVRDAAGGLAVGLIEERESGFEGIAYLVPDPDGPAMTDIRIFIAPRLAEEDRATPVAN